MSTILQVLDVLGAVACASLPENAHVGLDQTMRSTYFSVRAILSVQSLLHPSGESTKIEQAAS